MCGRCRDVVRSFPSRRVTGSEKVLLDHFIYVVTLSVEYRFNRIYRHAVSWFHRGEGWHYQFHRRDLDIEQRRSWLGQPYLHRFFQIVCFGDGPSPEPHCLGDLAKIWIFQIRVGRHHAFGLLLHFHEAELGVVVDRNLDREVLLDRGQHIAHHHGEAAVSGEGDHLTPWLALLQAQRGRNTASHRPVKKAGKDASFSVRIDEPMHPDGGRAVVGGEERVLVCELIDDFREVSARNLSVATRRSLCPH